MANITLNEEQLRFEFNNVQSGVKFDMQPPTLPEHDLLGGKLRPVDFIIETADSVFFIEVKDPKHIGARSRDVKEFMRKARGTSTELGDTLISKCKDTYINRVCTGNQPDPTKNLFYYVLITGLDTALLVHLTEQLQSLPVLKPGGAELEKLHSHDQRWDFVNAAAAFNLQTWRARFPDFLVERKLVE
ncbi:MAG: hypothetical protein U9Q70_13870 [Chloroflexota bacterium]|nr:hypothetical protein [Chloroflexota bacterium]